MVRFLNIYVHNGIQMDATGNVLAMPRHTASPQNSLKRDKIVEIFADVVPLIAGAVARTLPPSFERDDLEQIGSLALIEAAPKVESYLRTCVFGAMRNAARGTYREAKDISISDAPEPVSIAPSPELRVINEEKRRLLREAVGELPEKQALILTARFGEQPRGRGRPRSTFSHRESQAIAGLRVKLLARAA